MTRRGASVSGVAESSARQPLVVYAWRHGHLLPPLLPSPFSLLKPYFHFAYFRIGSSQPYWDSAQD